MWLFGKQIVQILKLTFIFSMLTPFNSKKQILFLRQIVDRGSAYVFRGKVTHELSTFLSSL